MTLSTIRVLGVATPPKTGVTVNGVSVAFVYHEHLLVSLNFLAQVLFTVRGATENPHCIKTLEILTTAQGSEGFSKTSLLD